MHSTRTLIVALSLVVAPAAFCEEAATTAASEEQFKAMSGMSVLGNNEAPNPAEFLNSQRMTELIAAFRQEFDFVIFDCPPILPVTDAAILASKTDGVLIVYRVGKIARSALKRAKTLLENVRGTVLGMVLTGLKAEISPDYEELEYYRYAYGHEPRRASGTTSGRAGKASGALKKFLGIS